MSAEEAALAARIVQAVLEASKRVPDWITHLFPGLTYFSYYDHWYYIAVMDDRVCPDCGPRDKRVYYGDSLRLEFPWLEVEGANAIHPHVHKNCRCVMLRQEWLLEKKVKV